MACQTVSMCVLPISRSPRATSLIGGRVRTATTVVILIGALAGCATREIPPANTTLPESLRTPPQEVLEDALTAVGETIYNCRRSAGRLSWVDKGSEATLVDGARRNIGTLVPGPRFIAYDGSYVSGRVAAQEIVAADAVPWELIIARRAGGAEQGKGRFAKVTSVQQVRTRGGLPPQTACTQQGISLLVPFSATYLVYRLAATQPLAKPAPEGTTTPVPTTAPVVSPLSSAAAPAPTFARAPVPPSVAKPVQATAPTLAHASPITAAPIAPPASVPPASPNPVLTIASAPETSGVSLPTFLTYIRP